MPEYTFLAVLVVAAAVALELIVLRTGIFSTLQYWISMIIVLAFQIPVDGYLTKLNAPIVEYANQHTLGVRWPWDIPIEDFAFGFALVTITLALWQRQLDREASE